MTKTTKKIGKPDNLQVIFPSLPLLFLRNVMFWRRWKSPEKLIRGSPSRDGEETEDEENLHIETKKGRTQRTRGLTQSTRTLPLKTREIRASLSSCILHLHTHAHARAHSRSRHRSCVCISRNTHLVVRSFVVCGCVRGVGTL